MTAATKKAGTRANSAKKRPPEVHVEKPKEVNLLEGLPTPDEVEKQAKTPYPATVRVYAYQPKDGSEPILLPLNGFEQPDKVWHFDTAQLPVLAQTWAWMRRANVPKPIQRQACSLPDDEYFGMFDEWFDVMKKFRDAGPRGAVTSGK